VFIGLQAEMAPALIRAEDDPSYFYVVAPLRI
jgi:DNA polymerase III sliding clamp (beta) subunit (PCNA family)